MITFSYTKYFVHWYVSVEEHIIGLLPLFWSVKRRITHKTWRFLFYGALHKEPWRIEAVIWLYWDWILLAILHATVKDNNDKQYVSKYPGYYIRDTYGKGGWLRIYMDTFYQDTPEK